MNDTTFTMPGIAHPFETLMSTEQFRLEFQGQIDRIEDRMEAIRLKQIDTNEAVVKLITTLNGYQGTQEQLLQMIRQSVQKHAEYLDGKEGLVTGAVQMQQQINGMQHAQALRAQAEEKRAGYEQKKWLLVWAAILAGLVKFVSDWLTNK